MHADRAQIGIDTQFAAQPQQAGLRPRTLACRRRPFRDRRWRPSRIASERKAGRKRCGDGSGSPCRSMAMPPNGASPTARNSWPKRAARWPRSTGTAWAMTSGPTPSAGEHAGGNVRLHGRAFALFGRRSICALVLDSRKPELVYAVQQAIARETLDRKFNRGAVGQPSASWCPRSMRDLGAGVLEKPLAGSVIDLDRQ